jgi:hypothetical protein
MSRTGKIKFMPWRRMGKRILDFDTSWRWVVSFMPWHLYPGIHWIGGWVGPRTSMNDVKRKKILPLLWLKLCLLSCPAHIILLISCIWNFSKLYSVFFFTSLQVIPINAWSGPSTFLLSFDFVPQAYILVQFWGNLSSFSCCTYWSHLSQ